MVNKMYCTSINKITPSCTSPSKAGQSRLFREDWLGSGNDVALSILSTTTKSQRLSPFTKWEQGGCETKVVAQFPLVREIINQSPYFLCDLSLLRKKIKIQLKIINK